MHAHLSFHRNNHHDGFFHRVARDLGAAMEWITGPAMSRQRLLDRAQAEARNQKYGYGIL